MDATLRHPPPRRPTPQPPREQDPHENLAEATEVNRPATLLPTVPGPEAKEEPHTERGHHETPSTVAGTEVELSGHIEPPHQPAAVPFPQQRSESPVLSEPLRDLLVPFLSCDQALIDLIVAKQPPFQ